MDWCEERPFCYRAAHYLLKSKQLFLNFILVRVKAKIALLKHIKKDTFIKFLTYKG